MKPLIHYIFRHPMPIRTSKDRFNVKFVQKEFFDEYPILARKRALEFYKSYADVYEEGIRVMEEGKLENDSLEGIQFELEGEEVVLDLSSVQEIKKFDIGKLLNLDLIAWYSENPEILFRADHGPAVVLVKDRSLLKSEDDSAELIIQEYNLNRENVEPYSISELMMHLEEEQALYVEHGYDIGEEKITVSFWDAEIFYEGGEGELIVDDHQVLRTDFDWDKFSHPNWWNDPDFDDILEGMALARVPSELVEEIQVLLQSVEDPPKASEADSEQTIPSTVKKKKTDAERIRSGETFKVEFKPTLFQQAGDRDFKHEAAKTICAFLNQKGGYLYIGVADDGSVKGVSLLGMSKDEFLKKFTTEVVNYYLERGIADACVKGKFIDIEDKLVFRIRVNASTRPVFLINRDTQPLKQEFYVRREASSRLLWNPRTIVDYVQSHWCKKNRSK